MIKVTPFLIVIALLFSCDKSDNNESKCEDLSGYDFGDCLAVIGTAWDGEKCATFSGCNRVDKNGIDHSDSFFNSKEECQKSCE